MNFVLSFTDSPDATQILNQLPEKMISNAAYMVNVFVFVFV